MQLNGKQGRVILPKPKIRSMHYREQALCDMRYLDGRRVCNVALRLHTAFAHG